MKKIEWSFPAVILQPFSIFGAMCIFALEIKESAFIANNIQRNGLFLQIKNNIKGNEEPLVCNTYLHLQLQKDTIENTEK